MPAFVNFGKSKQKMAEKCGGRAAREVEGCFG